MHHPASVTGLNISQLIIAAVNVPYLIVTYDAITQLNYRTARFSGSVFWRISRFRKYSTGRRQGDSGSARAAGRSSSHYLVVLLPEMLLHGGVNAAARPDRVKDPGLPENGSARRKPDRDMIG
nr:hypothetical protein [Pectobacterium carotovorum]